MDPCRSPLHFLLLLSLSILPALTTASPSDDINALLEFKKGIVDPTGSVLSSWVPPNTLSCPATWRGVTCDPASGAVISLSLTSLNLTGELKFSTLTGLRYLQSLSLSGNAFTGRLVPGLGSMTSLSRIDLSSNQFYGPVPDRLTDLSGLVHLNLSMNNFSQGFPPSFRKLQQLRVIDLRSNGIWGDIGELITQLRNTEYVDLSGNVFTGGFGIDPSNLTSLGNTVRYFNLSFNNLNSGFFTREAVPMFKSLEVLDLTSSGINGELPPLGMLYNLRVLKLRGNKLLGSLPEGIFQSSMQLREIDLSLNGFTGSIPIINSTTLTTLNLSSNSLTGQLPLSVTNIISLDLSNNDFTGDLTVLSKWGSTLETLKLGNNSLSGPLPSVLGSYPKLSVLDLSLNKFTGSILASLFTLLTLTSINLSGNNFTGFIPIKGSPHSTESLVLPSYTYLEVLDLSSNFLSGPIPPEMGNMQRLRVLSLARNNLTGVIPVELTKLDGLEILDLSNNNFTGPIPDLSQPGLTSFNVSYNDLSGIVPKTLEKFPASSFLPGNPGLIFPDGVPAGNSNLNPDNLNPNGGTRRHVRSAVRVALIIGCIGVIILLIFAAVALYMVRSQELCSRSGFFTNKPSVSRDLNFSRFNLFNSQKDDSAAIRSLGSHSRSMSAQKELLSEAAEFGSGLELSANHIASPLPARISEQNTANTFEVYSPDRLVGDLTFLESSIVFTPDELAQAPAEVIGRSSHGTSYRARMEGGQVLTVKWLRVGLVRSKREFTREAKRIGGIRHANLVHWRGFYWGPREQERFIISDFVLGDSLALYLYESTPRRYSRLSVSQRLKIAMDISRALFYLHQEKNLPHGNLKPTNILLTGPDLTAKLTDYGLHRLMMPAGTAEQILNLGALGYRAPELANNNNNKPSPTFKSDVYAFGVILMEMLTRKSAGDIISGQSGAVDLTDWVQMCNREGRGPDCFDRDIAGLEENSRVMDELLAISLKCILPVNERPDIKTVFEDLCRITI